MKNEFKGFYNLKESEFEYLWKNAVFVFDTNVLLNLYRYQESTTEQLIKVIEHLKERIWIPYHVALEYQRNRLKVIASQNTKFSEVRKVINKGTSSLKGELDNLNLKKRHSTIEPESFINDISSAAKKFLDELDSLEKNHFSVISEDKIRVRLDALLDGKVGTSPADQKVINQLEKEAEVRFKNKIPPGYMDDDKEKSDEPIFSYANLTYQRKYSDYVVWSQMMSFANENKVSNLIFVTDDNKEDWWLKVKQNGEKTISPRPELMGEISQRTEVEHFHMYSSEGFLKYANEILRAGVSSEAIEEVRDVARTNDRESSRMMLMRNMGRTTEKAVYNWLVEQYGEDCLVQPQHAPIDLIAKLDGKTVAFDIKAIRNPRHSMERLRHLIYEAHFYSDKNDIDELVFVLVTFDSDHIETIKKSLERRLRELPPITIMIGVAELNEDTGMVTDFVSYDQFKIDNA
jgi:uncharacterized protein YaaQ